MMNYYPLYLSKVRHLNKSWIWLLLAAGLAACTGATEPAEPTPLPVETEEVQPEPTEVTAANPTAESLPPTMTAPPTQSAEVPAVAEAPADTPPGPTPLPALVLPDLGRAPDFTNEVWLNTEGPLNLETLRGKVVLVEFWTFG
jgi:hypothetical protein